MPAVFLRSIVSAADFPPTDAPHIAVVGRSNVGKSSFVNRLTGQKALAKVSSNPGRTRTINLFEVDRRFLLVDLPGYGFARAAKEEHAEYVALIDEYLAHARRLALVLVIIDARHGATDLDRAMFARLTATNTPFAVIANKTDKLPRSKALALLRDLAADLPDITLLPCSMTTGDGLGTVRAAIETAIRSAASSKRRKLSGPTDADKTANAVDTTDADEDDDEDEDEEYVPPPI